MKKLKCLHKGDEVLLAKAALLEPVSVAIHALRLIDFNDDDTVTIFWGGLIGSVMAKFLAKWI